MSLQTRLGSLITAIGADIKALNDTVFLKSRWHYGNTGQPAPDFGDIGDWYFDRLEPAIWRKTAINNWLLIEDLSLAIVPTFSASKTATQVIGAAGTTKVTFPFEEYDHGVGYDTVNSRYTAPETGIYRITAQIVMANAQAGVDLRIYKNGAYYGFVDHRQSSSYLLAGSLNLQLAAGDTVEVYVNLTAGNTINANLSNTRFQGELIRST